MSTINSDLKKSINLLLSKFKRKNIDNISNEIVKLILERDEIYKKRMRIKISRKFSNYRNFDNKPKKIILENPFTDDLDYDLMDYIFGTVEHRIFIKSNNLTKEDNECMNIKSFLVKFWIEKHLSMLLFYKKRYPERFNYKKLDIILELIENYDIEFGNRVKDDIIPKLLDKNLKESDNNDIRSYINELDSLFSNWNGIKKLN